MKRKSTGFTIVELLIVIVIIGILAALVILTYNGIQQRARNTSRVASAKEVQKLMAAYVAQEGKYPYASRACLGEGYTDWDADGTLDCYISSFKQHPEPALNTELLKVVSRIPNIEASIVKGIGFDYSGYVYYPSVSINGKAGRVMLIYWLEGANQKCGINDVLVYNSTTLTYETTGAPSTIADDGNATRCYIAINEP